MSASFPSAFLAAGLMLAASAPSGAATARTVLSPAAPGLASEVAHARGLRDFGRIPPNRLVHVGVLMRFRHEAEVRELTILQGRRNSPYFHRYLSAAQWNAYFAPDEATYRRAQLTLARSGFRIEGTFANRGMILASAPARTAERFFNTELHQVFQPGRGVRYANVRPALMPAELRGAAVSVAGLHSIVTVHFPLQQRRWRATSYVMRPIVGRPLGRTPAIPSTPSPTPKPITTSTPGPNPSPDATESPESPVTDYANFQGYGPPIWAMAYDYPVEHGYSGTHHAAGSVIDSDFSDVDANAEFTDFHIPRTGSAFRVCTDPNNQCTICDPSNFSTTCDPIGESTLDAQTIMTLAPGADFYEYLINSKTSLIDLNVETAYERVVSDDVVDVVNSSFGACETDDPSFEDATNYIAMEGAAKGVTFSASSGDTGATGCGVYATNGAPQSEVNIGIPAGDTYFTGVGGTSFDPDLTGTGSFYNATPPQEQAWLDGGGGHSVFEPIPAWQTAAAAAASPAAMVSTTFRNIPDVALTADGGAVFIGGTQGVGLLDVYNGLEGPTGGTSLSSPMWVAMQTEINQVQGSRNGFVNPRLYAIATANSAEYAFAFHDITLGTNNFYTAETGYDDATGLGSPKGWELAGTE